ncbi:MAG: TonB family protein [Ignavibacteria bacterium]|nr:MAG: TonB family protein [Ignavibacteria bacterium]KAF0161597.1 MAG: TonB family protein [Ignavibacteria bacterium]
MILKKLNIESTSALISIGLHTLILAVFFLLSAMSTYDDLVEIRFGEPGGGSGGFGPMDKEYSMMDVGSTINQSVVNDKMEDEKQSVDVPEAAAKASDKDEEKVFTSTEMPENVKPVKVSDVVRHTAGNNPDGRGIGSGRGTGSGIGDGRGSGFGDGLGDGFGIDWGGRIRKIYNYIIPKYPEGVYKEIDVKLRFSILPDGSVGKINVVKKADSKLEQVAIEALKLWRFEPLSGLQASNSQMVTITFPFRLE